MGSSVYPKRVDEIIENSINSMEDFIQEVEVRVNELKELIENFINIYKLEEEIEKNFKKALSLL